MTHMYPICLMILDCPGFMVKYAEIPLGFHPPRIQSQAQHDGQGKQRDGPIKPCGAAIGDVGGR